MKLWMPTTKLAASSQTVAAVVVASSSSSAVANVNSTPADAKQVSPMRTGNFPASSSSSSSSSQSRLIGTSASTTTTTTEPTALTSVTTTGPQPLGKQPRSDNIPIPETITTTSAQGRREQDLSREIEQENKQVEDEVLAEYRDHVMFQRIYGPRPRQSQSRNHCLPPRRRTPRGEAVNRRASSATHTNQPPPPPFSHIYLHQQQPYHGHPPPHKFIPFALLQHPPDFAPVVASQLDPRCCCPCSSNDHYHHAPMTAPPVVVLTPPTTSAATFTPATICPLQQHLNHNRLTATGFEITNTGPMLSYPEVEGVFDLDL